MDHEPTNGDLLYELREVKAAVDQLQEWRSRVDRELEEARVIRSELVAPVRKLIAAADTAEAVARMRAQRLSWGKRWLIVVGLTIAPVASVISLVIQAKGG